MKDLTTKRILVIFILIVFTLINGCGNNQREKNEEEKRLKNLAQVAEENKENIRRDEKIKKIAAKFNAVIDWEKKIKKNYFTIDIQKALLDELIGPVLLKVYVVDISLREGDQIVRFSSLRRYERHSSWRLKVNFELKCDPKFVTKILSSSNRDDRFADDIFAVVAKINKVNKIDFVLFPSQKYEDEGPKIEIKGGPKISPIIAKGECLDVEYLGEG